MTILQRTSAQPSLRPGVYTPLPTFFYEDEEMNLDEYRKHLLRAYMTKLQTVTVSKTDLRRRG